MSASGAKFVATARIVAGVARDVVLGSSVRAFPAEVTLARARKRARSLGVTRVTDITRIDRIGLPVYASIRPGAAAGSLCVNGGKGTRPVDAEVGATMEAIEFAIAEPGASALPIVTATARDVLDGHTRPEAVLDLCPRIGARIRLDAPMDVVVATETSTGRQALVPAELVFLPYDPAGRRRAAPFGASSNGLASGNTLQEATAHALCELVERDVRSLHAVDDGSAPVALDGVDGPAADLLARIRAAGIQVHVRTADAGLGIPYFSAVLEDLETPSPLLLSAGYGCHPSRSVALVRAVAEAVQSRLTIIHGGRDDLVDHDRRFRGWTLARKRGHVEQVVARARRGQPVAYARVPDLASEATSVAACERILTRRLRATGFDRVYRVAFCAARDPIQVVRIIVPRLEFFSDKLPRVGARLRDRARAA